MKRLLQFVPFISFLILTTVAGCSKADKPVFANVKGTVMFNGKPIEKGKVIFGSEGRAPTAIDIIDGKFSGQAVVGPNKVSVAAKRRSANAPALSPQAQIQLKGYKDKFSKVKNQGGGTINEYDGAMVDFIPPEWGSQSTQSYIIQSGATNEVDFNIKGP
jgi:hypothetical protein